ncbi:MAG: capsule biosynthesis protein CapK [Massilia sp.]
MNSERDNFPTLSDAGRRTLQMMREHPSAPIFRNTSGNKLLAHEVEALRAFERSVMDADIGWTSGTVPDWVMPFVAKAYEDVPHYRAHGSPPRQFADLAPVTRANLAADIAQFVPDSVSTERMINFRTTGTTGQPLLIASHPMVAGSYLAFHKRALQRVGVTPGHGKGQVGVMLLGHQRRCFTYVSVTPTMDESGLAKINLHPNDWRDIEDRARYLDAMAPEILAGDPISFAELLALPVTLRPRALLSVSMMLLPGMRQRLEQRFACPVLDIYSLNEVGPVAVFDAQLGGHLLLQPQLFVEILDASGQSVPDGERGEITLTGGFNFCLPLLRYRTGDYGALRHTPHGPVIMDLSGRSPVRFLTAGGEWVNNVDVTHALHPLAIAHYSVHQAADGSLVLRLCAAAMALADDATRALAGLFGSQAVSVQALEADDKTLQYTSDLAGAQA